MQVPIDYFEDFRPSHARMAKKSLLQIFPIELFVKAVYLVLKILHNYHQVG